MNSFGENDIDLCRNSIKYLHDVTTLPEVVPALKSFYSTKRRLMELRKGILLPSSFTRTSVTCQRCLISLNEGPASYRVIASKKQSNFARKLLAKQKAGKSFTPFQQSYMGKLNNFRGNHLAITCKFCKNEALIKMEKPKRKVKQKVVKPLKSKKKRKKDKFCGLKQDVILSLETNNKTESGLKKKKKKVKISDMETVSCLTPQNMRNLDTIDKIEQKHTRLTMKVKKIEQEKISDVSKENLMKSKQKLKNKKKHFDKLHEILNKSEGVVKSPISSLKQFLQGL